MTLEATYRQVGDTLDYTPTAALTGGQVIQLKDGRAAVPASDIAAGALGAVGVRGVYRLAKTAGIVLLDGGKAYWDHSANKVHFKKVNDRDFYVGTIVGDAASADTEVDVALNVEPVYLVDLARDPFDTAIVAGGLLNSRGGALNMKIAAALEAQKADALSKDGFAPGANAIVEFAFEVVDDGAGTAVDVSLGIANATHASDGDAIVESVFVHLDADNVNILAESDDGTTEVAATDTTKDYTVGSRHEVWMDMRDPADVQIYVDGVLVLGATVFNVVAAVGPWKLLAHVEKSSSTDTYELDVDWARARIAED